MRMEQYLQCIDYTLWEIVEKIHAKNIFGGNNATKKNQKNLLKQQYENFAATSTEVIEQTYERLQNLISQLEMHGEGAADSSTTVENLSDAVIYSFFASQRKARRFPKEILEGARHGKQRNNWVRILQKSQENGQNRTNKDTGTEKRIQEPGECYQRAPRENRNREPVRRNVTVETTETKALVAQDGLGYDWSDQAEEGPTNFALMAYTSSGSSSSSSSDSEVSTCSKACLKSYETLKEHYDNLTKDFNKSQLNVGAYKAGLESVEARLDVYKKNEVVFEEDIKILKLDIMLRDNALTELRKKFEKAEKERDDLKLTLEKFENSSKNLSKLLEIQVSDKFKTSVGYDSQVVDSQVCDSQVNDKYKTCEGYHAVPPPYIGNFMPPKPNLVLADEEEYVFSESITSVPAVATSKVKPSESKPKSVSEPLIEDWISDSEDENDIEFKSKQRKPSFAKVKFVKSNEHVKIPREFVMKYQLMLPDQLILPTSRTAVNNAGPMKNVINNAYSTARRPFNKITAANNSNFTKKVNTVKGTRVNTARPKAVLSAVKGNKGNAVKASACWVWRPKHKVLDHGNPQQDLKDKGVIDSGCSRHMTGNRSYLTDYEEIDGGFVAFGGNSKGGKITGKGKIRTGKLDFEDVYFVKELKFNLFSVSQMCDKKNSVLFTDTECVVLSPDFKLTDESHVLLKVPRKNNMYSIDLKNVVPQGGLTCLFAKATSDESNLWHRRLGHVNFKTINKLVKGNLVKVIRCDNETEFKNKVMNQFCEMKGRKPALSFMRPFGCPVTILNTIDHLGSRPNWLFDIDALTKSMNYEPVIAGKQSNGSADPSFSSSSKDSPDAGFKPSREEEKKDVEHPENEDSEVPNIEELRVNQEQDANVNSPNNINIVSPTVNVAGIKDNDVDENIVYGCAMIQKMPNLEDTSIFGGAYDDEDFVTGGDMNNLKSFMPVSPIATTRVHKDHPVEQIIGDLHSAPQIRRMTKNSEEHGFYGIKEEVYVFQPPGFKDPEFLDSVYKVEKALYGLHEALRAWYETLSTYLLENRFQRGTIDKTLFIKKVKVQPMETSKPLLKDAEAKDVDVYLYRSMIGSLRYLTSSRPDIMFVVCACARFQVTPKVSHLHAVKRIFRYLKVQPKLGLGYPKDSLFDLETYTNSDYAGASLDRKSMWYIIYHNTGSILGLG
ncbi:ribonuclease H-like domain-containing protein [Tanacetum coccineum]